MLARIRSPNFKILSEIFGFGSEGLQGLLTNGPLVTVVQKLDSDIHRISSTKTNCVIRWIVIYPVDSAIQLLNNWSWVYKFVNG